MSILSADEITESYRSMARHEQILPAVDFDEFVRSLDIEALTGAQA